MLLTLKLPRSDTEEKKGFLILHQNRIIPLRDSIFTAHALDITSERFEGSKHNWARYEKSFPSSREKLEKVSEYYFSKVYTGDVPKMTNPQEAKSWPL